MIPRTSTSAGASHNGRPSLDDRLAHLTFCVNDNMFSGWRWRIFCMSGWCATFALQFIFVRSHLKSDEFVSKAAAFHVGVSIEPGPSIYGLWLLHRITEDNNAHAMAAALDQVWTEHSKTNRGLDYIPWRCWTLYSLAMSIARKFFQDGSYRGWSSWIELDNPLIRQLEISIVQNFPLWVPQDVEGGQGWIRYPDYWQLELAKIHRSAELLEAYVTPDEHSMALSTFEEAFRSLGSGPLVGGWDTDIVGILEPRCPSPLSEQSQSPFISPSPSVEGLDSGATAPPPGHIHSFSTPLSSLPPSGFVPTPCENTIVFGSPEIDDGYRGLTHCHYSPPQAHSTTTVLGVWRVVAVCNPLSPINLTEPGLSREDPILISDLPVQSEPPNVIFGSPPPHSPTSWSSSIPSTSPGVTLRIDAYSHVSELDWNSGTMGTSNPYFSLPV